MSAVLHSLLLDTLVSPVADSLFRITFQHVSEFLLESLTVLSVLLLLQKLADGLPIMNGHLILLMSHKLGLICLIICDLAENLQEGRDHRVRGVLRLNAKNARLAFNRHVRFNHKVDALVDEALADLTDLFTLKIALLASFEIFAGGDLFLLLNLFTGHKETDFVLVDKCIVFANLSYNVLIDQLVGSTAQEGFIDLEKLSSNMRRHLQVMASLRRHQEVLANIGRK